MLLPAVRAVVGVTCDVCGAPDVYFPDSHGPGICDVDVERDVLDGSPPVAASATEERPPDLGVLLDEVHATYTSYVVFPSPEVADAVTLFTVATHAQSAWEHASRLVLSSPVKRCGKTRTLEILRELAHNVVVAANASTAALVRSIDDADPPTLILDEADVVFGGKREREGAEDLRGILNAGHSRGWPYLRWDPKSRSREECPTFAMAALGGIGEFPDTIRDRGIVANMRRRAAGEAVSAWRTRRAVPRLRDLRGRLNDAVRPRLEELAAAEPDLPVEDRAADVWEPLVAIADAAGGTWPERARAACRNLSGLEEPEDATAGERLLADLGEVWRDEEPTLPTAEILSRLQTLDEAPWADWYGGPLPARGLAKLLKPYGIRSRNLKIGASVAKGYVRSDLEDAWSRYTRPSATTATDATELEIPPLSSEKDGSGGVADTPSRIRYRSEQQQWGLGSGVAVVADGRLDGAGDPSSAGPLSDAILAVLREDGPQPVPEIARRLGVTWVAVREGLLELEAEGRVWRYPADGGIEVWGLREASA